MRRPRPAAARWGGRSWIQAADVGAAGRGFGRRAERDGRRPARAAPPFHSVVADHHLGDGAIPFVAVPRGKGGRLAATPLAEGGVEAARDFVAQGAFGSWSCPRANKALVRAAGHARRRAFTVYAIRHSFAAGLRRTGTDVADIQDLYGHTNPRTTVIYAPPQLVKHQAAIARLRALESGTTRKRLAVPGRSL